MRNLHRRGYLLCRRKQATFSKVHITYLPIDRHRTGRQGNYFVGSIEKYFHPNLIEKATGCGAKGN